MESFFIIGAQRSGTTLLRLMLNAHSKVSIPEEGTFWMPLLRRYKRAPNRLLTEKQLQKDLQYIVSNSQFKLWDISAAELREKINLTTCPDLYSLINRTYSIYSAKHDKVIWGDKTPSFFRMIPALSELFKRASFIHIIRDGRDLHLSWRKMDSSKSNIAVGALEWQHKVICAQQDLLKFAESRHLEIRYEDLVANPSGSLKNICHFLKIDFEPEMLNYWKQSHKFIGEHHSKLIFRPLSTNSVNKWKKNLSSSELNIFETIAGKCLSQNKYQLSSESRHLWSFIIAFLKLTYGLPFRAGQVSFTMVRLGFASYFGTATKASGGN